MADNPRVQQLLQEILDNHSTPDAVCSSCPDLLPQVRTRWEQMNQVRDELDAMFPPESDPGSTPPKGTSLPVIPGYEVESVLGLGGMGVVYQAKHLRLNRIVALKMALAGHYAGPHERERFQREAEAVAALQHPNIVQIYDVGDCDGRPYFTMEHVDGGSLAEKLSGSPLPIREAAQVVATLASAIHVAHLCEIVHRDLKPANVLLTADGTPKITDFGLARRMQGETGLTHTGIAIGTPTYMAPEQAGESTDAAGPPADIYALGAILYELLTGKPPFKAETVAATLYQLTSVDPVPPSRLKSKVPRDLETICLKCLQKEPQHRYATATALAQDLECFLRGEAITARPEGRLARWVRRVRRRPVLSAALTVATLSTVALIWGGVWTLSERRAAARTEAAKEQAADDDLREMEKSLRVSSWPAARAALERARGRLGGGGSEDQRRILDQGIRELELIARLNAIRLDGYSLADNGLDFRRSDQEYEEAFLQAGFGRLANHTPAAAAEKVSASFVRQELVAALAHWASCYLDDRERKARLLEIVRLADPDTTGWRARTADPAIWRDDAALAKLLATAPAANPPLSVILLFEVRLTAVGKDPVPLLRKIQMSYPDDFWVNARLARSLYLSDPSEAARFYQAALAIRPDAVVIQNDLGLALTKSGRRDEAVELFRRAVKQTPTFAPAQTNLAVILSRLGRHDEAIVCVRAALATGIRTSGLYTAHGHSLLAKGQSVEALAEFRQAITLTPNYLSAQSAIKELYLRQGQFPEAQAAWKEMLDHNFSEHKEWYGYAELCLFLNLEEDYRNARKALLTKFGSTSDLHIAERTGRAGLLLPVTGEELQKATELAERAAGADRGKQGGAYPYFQFVRALAEYRHSKFDKAIAILRKETAGMQGPSPQLVLAMALHGCGQVAEARKTLTAAIASHDWSDKNIKGQDDWIRHSLRREAERLINSNQDR